MLKENLEAAPHSQDQNQNPNNDLKGTGTGLILLAAPWLGSHERNRPAKVTKIEDGPSLKSCPRR
jgi:hypothetical protein